MRALILSGEVTHQRPMSYGFSGDWEVSTLSVVDNDHIAVCEKYGDPRSVSQAEVMTFIKRAYDRTVLALQDSEPDAIVGVGYGAHVLVNLNSSHEWRGVSTFVLTEGSPTRFCFAQGPLPDEIDYEVEHVPSAWFTVDDDTSRGNRATRTGVSLRRLSDLRRSDIIVCVPGLSALDSLYASGVVSGVTRSLVK